MVYYCFIPITAQLFVHALFAVTPWLTVVFIVSLFPLNFKSNRLCSNFGQQFHNVGEARMFLGEGGAANEIGFTTEG